MDIKIFEDVELLPYSETKVKYALKYASCKALRGMQIWLILLRMVPHNC